MKDHGGLIGGLRIVQHGEVVHRAGGFHRVVSKGHILRRQGLPIGEGHVVPDGHRPGEAVLADGVSGGHGESGLDQGLVDVFPGPPAEGRVKAGGGLRVGVHGHHYCVRPLGGAGGGGAGGIPPAAGQEQGARENDGYKKGKSLHRDTSF